MLPNGRLVPWRSPHGVPLHIAAAAPWASFSDLVYALAPNGRTLDYRVTSPTADLSPRGVEKESIAGGLFAVGAAYGYFAPPGLNPQATRDLVCEPRRRRAVQHARGQVDDPADRAVPVSLLPAGGRLRNGREAPAPLFLANGFTDDIFPVDENLRYYNLERSLYPSDPISLFALDGGHQRGQNKSADLACSTPASRRSSTTTSRARDRSRRWA